MEENYNQNLIEEEMRECQLGFTDKIIGIFTEPSKLFSELAKFPPKAADWVIPLIFLFIVTMGGNFLMMTNPVLKQQMQEKQMQRMEQSMKDMVEKGQITKDQAAQQIESSREMMESGGMALQMSIGAIAGLIMMFVFFLLVGTFFFMIAKFVLKGDGTWTGTLVALGLPNYILVINGILIFIVAMATDNYITGLNPAAFMELETGTLAHAFLSKLDPLTIWSYLVVSIGLAKMFKSENTTKYIITVMFIWIGFSILMALLAIVFPFLKNFII